ncbi:MAG: radical SAM protein [Dissulfurimicrobium sp.]|uniref:radical SAM protein n=1 Tax=Dissulfurimicrobium sp. TaxID=2022436 RepID=UPI0040491D99
MYKSFSIGDITVFPDEHGLKDYISLSYPARYGITSRLIFSGYQFECDLNGAVKRIHSENHMLWPEPFARLRRLEGDGWLFYHPSAYDDIYALTGRYYLPIASCNSLNSFAEGDPFGLPWVARAVSAWDELCAHALECIEDVADEKIIALLASVGRNHGRALETRSKDLYSILGGTIPVLPPETMFVDYDVIPILISDSCLYRCGFCRFKTAGAYSVRTAAEIKTQIERLKGFYGRDIVNYSSVFLGQNDALLAGDIVLEAAETAYRAFDLAHSYHTMTHLFLFGSIGAFLNATDGFLKKLDGLQYSQIHINVGIESIDEMTLKMLGKPISLKEAMDAIDRACLINRTSKKTEISLNFIMMDGLSGDHHEKISHLFARLPKVPKGAVYLSPLLGYKYDMRKLRRFILESKALARWPVFLYWPIGMTPCGTKVGRLGP